MAQAYTFYRTEETVIRYKNTIIADTRAEAERVFEEWKENGLFYDDAEIDFENVSNVTEEIEYEDEWDRTQVREML